MGNLVIVAIPDQDDRVWKVSSEKVPHLTLLFLGDAESNPNVNRIFEFVWHAVNTAEHGPFMLRKDYRSVLGEDKADVIHFEKDWSFKWVKEFRNQLLQQADIRAAYDSTEQFPEWRPHLTLGYPETPAKELENEYDLDWVTFDRIAVWTGNYEGPEFRLKWPEREGDTALAYSAAVKEGEEAVEEFLEHYGVKGMRWGHRKDDSGGAGFTTRRERNAEMLTDAAKKAAPAVKRGLKRFGRAIDRAADRMVENEEKRFSENANSKEVYKSIKSEAKLDYKTLDKPDIDAKYYGKNVKTGPLAKEYKREHQEAFRKRLDEHANAHKSWSGKKKYVIKDDPDNPKDWWVDVADVEHAGLSAFAGARVIVTFDDNGFIKDIEPQDPPEDAAHSIENLADAGAEWLAHYGVKGMKWGVRKSDGFSTTTAAIARNQKGPPEAKKPEAVSVVPHNSRRKTKIKVDGGENHPATKDALKTAEAKAKLKKSGPDALTNQELRDVATRLQLEKQVSDLTRNKGQKWVTDLFRSQRDQEINTRLQVNRRQRLAPQ